MGKIELIKKIEDKVICLIESPLYKFRIKNNYIPVIGEGSLNAEIMFIGEAPGKNEAMTGKPFCGKSGKLLDEFLKHDGIKREDVYITNIVKDRPQENRDPTPKEIEIYGPLLDEQINIIQPKVICTQGRYSMEYILKKFGLDSKIEKVGKAHGKVYDAEASYGSIKIVCLFHPAVAIYNSTRKGELMKDFEVLKKFI